ncbi:hypothetical protein CL6EHI_105320 [Entamoeba histolytica]|uniref:Peptidase S74 domain-containing protein n=2 Tax=Entamoeba histolytica TaxID=5759 RepID=C4M136_ENTH1|nr:hypothetical protein EHI_105320 [Entamoeba histolytica HM-1:IMSS]EAL48556.1 hypothetical protein EHI_105320 [Entamoeba histolytica HM-1:IMSS]GAT94909.1 hypothetical protein CL6EHI_105320 [Entamoeba histolytica]|eukprot:XP_653943.1 hypothetical protein EHI_105320 [Entamoeba histolytica HM-1:IMSS]
MQEPNQQIEFNGNGILLVSSEEIQRTQKQRKKNWKCIFPNCNEPAKTRFNCYAHVWDIHLREYYKQKFPELSPTTPFKKTQNKAPLKNLCEKYMIQLVEKQSISQKLEGKLNNLTVQNYNNHIETPITITEQNSSDILEIELPLFNQFNTPKQLQSLATFNNSITQSIYPFSFFSTYQNNNQHNNQLEYIEIEQPFQSATTIAIEDINQINSNIQNNTEFIKIEEITNQIKRLHVFGEILAENGYLVRSDARSKTDIQTIENALNSVTSLVGKKYAYKNEPNKIKYGFIAQEVQEIIPDLVQKDETNNLSVDYLGLIPYIIEALKSIHDNSVSLQSSSRQEYIELSKKVEDVVSQLQKLMEENKQYIFLEKSSRVFGFFPLEFFGPPIVVLFMAISFTIFSIILPFILPYCYFSFIIVLVETIILWSVIIAQRKRINTLFKYPHLKSHWSLSQFFLWIIVFLLLHISFTISLILGYGGIIVSSIYFGIFLGLAVLAYIIYNSSHILHKGFIIIGLFIGVFVLTLISTIVLFYLQPFISLNIRGIDNPYHVNIYPKEPIIPMVLSSPPWNCFSPQIQSDIPLPQNLTLVMPSSLSPNSVLPTIRGIVSDDISTTTIDFYIVCSGFIKVSYGKVTFKSCETKTNQNTCLTNKCGWCSITKKCGYCEDINNLCNNDETYGC